MRPEEKQDDPYLSVKEAAALLGLSPNPAGGPATVRRWCQAGKLEATNLGGSAGWRIRRSELERFVKARTLRQAVAETLDLAS